MSRVLAQLAGKDLPEYQVWLRGLENATGSRGTDIRLSLHIANEVRDKTVQLGLDPTDTTGEELYGALKARLLADDARIEAGLGLADGKPEKLLAAIVSHLNTVEQKSEVIAMKPVVAKRILKKLAPKNTMKLLGYRSLDSMLKHESTAELLAATFIAESEAWHKKRLAAYQALTPSDFETRKVHFTIPTGKKWPVVSEEYTQRNRQNIVSVAELGTIVVLPLSCKLPALAITVITMCIHELNTIRSTSAFLKMHQVRPDFGEVIAGLSAREWSQVVELRNRQVHWNTLHWFFGSEHSNGSSHSELFEPHMQPEDMWLAETEDILIGLDPSLSFWKNSHFLGLLDGKRAVSLNILDVALSVCNARKYAERLVGYMSKALQREIIGRYLGYPVLQKEVLQSIERQLVPEYAIE
ncbi:MAG: hypothetical protein QG629_76 [Patescibacteria group bacterium]|nr:hypothetical protein [Candidatus Saccharibacteria bacterium]MDQ5962994.1 hypothetical protein [Patescibacteria group bacterium]